MVRCALSFATERKLPVDPDALHECALESGIVGRQLLAWCVI